MPLHSELVRSFLTAGAALAALAAPVSAAAQAAATTPPEPSLRTLFADLARDVRRLPSNPAGVSVALGGILSTSLSPLDDNLGAWDESNVYRVGTWAGNGAVLAVGTLVTYGVGHWSHEPRVKRVAADLLRAQALSLGIAYGLKYTVNRERPDHSSEDSFPSGHAAQTFASATVLARHLGPKVAWPAFGAASFIAISRVNQKRHFLSDVVFGAGIGVAVGWNAARQHSSWALAPEVSPSRFAVHIARLSTP